MAWKTILVPHDFSSCANHAAALARDLAQSHGAKLVLLHVAELPPGWDPDAMIAATPTDVPLPAREVTAAGARGHMEDLAGRLRKEGIEVTTLVRTGDVVEEILAAVQREGADLIVMGTHGRSGIAHMIVGSVAEKIVRQAPVPVLTLRATS